MDFEALDPDQARRWERWLGLERTWLGASISVAAATARARLSEEVESAIDPAAPGALEARAFLLRRRAAALDEIRRSGERRHLARARLARSYRSWDR